MRRRMGVVVTGAVIALLAGCGPASNDNPAFTGTSLATVPPPTLGAGGPAISTVNVGAVSTPHVDSGAAAATAKAINTATAAVAAHLGGGQPCSVTTTRSDKAVVSFRWTCVDRSSAGATFALAGGRRLALGDLFTGDYLQYLSSTAVAQLTLGGTDPGTANTAAAATAASFADWDLTADVLQVTFALPSGAVTVDFPLTPLAPYAAPGSPIAAH